MIMAMPFIFIRRRPVAAQEICNVRVPLIFRAGKRRRPGFIVRKVDGSATFEEECYQFFTTVAGRPAEGGRLKLIIFRVDVGAPLQEASGEGDPFLIGNTHQLDFRPLQQRVVLPASDVRTDAAFEDRLHDRNTVPASRRTAPGTTAPP